MRFAIATVDRYLGVFESFVQAGWTPLKLFGFPTADGIANGRAVTSLAQSQGASIQTTRITETDLQALCDQGCDALIVACYPLRIGPWQPFLRYAVNFHCSPLPEARGPYPVHRAILENRSHWAVTCHRLAADFDAGEILATERFPLQPDECHETLDLKIQMTAKRLAATIASQFVGLWESATPQAEGSYWPLSTLADRVIDFHTSVDAIMRHVRAFGSTETLAFTRGHWLAIKRAVGWTEPHHYAPGQLVHINDQSIVFAAVDGYIAVLDGTMAGPDLADQLDRTGNRASRYPGVVNEAGSKRCIASRRAG